MKMLNRQNQIQAQMELKIQASQEVRNNEKN